MNPEPGHVENQISSDKIISKEKENPSNTPMEIESDNKKEIINEKNKNENTSTQPEKKNEKENTDIIKNIETINKEEKKVIVEEKNNNKKEEIKENKEIPKNDGDNTLPAPKVIIPKEEVKISKEIKINTTMIIKANINNTNTPTENNKDKKDINIKESPSEKNPISSTKNPEVNIEQEMKSKNISNEKIIPVGVIEANKPKLEEKKGLDKIQMDIEKKENNKEKDNKDKEKIILTSSSIEKVESQNKEEKEKPKVIALDISKETKKENPIQNAVNIATTIQNLKEKEKEKEKTIPIEVKEKPKERIISLDIQEILKHSELPKRIKEAYNKMLENPKKQQGNQTITQILEGQKAEKAEKVEKVKRAVDNQTLIDQILEEKNVPLSSGNNNNINLMTNITNNNINITKEEKKEKKEKNRNDQILDILKGKLLNISAQLDSKRQENRNDVINNNQNNNDNKNRNNININNIYQKTIGSNYQNIYDRKIETNGNNISIFETNNKNMNYHAIMSNTPKRNYEKSYHNIHNMIDLSRQEMNKLSENKIEKNSNILIEKMPGNTMLNDEQYPKNLQITEYPRIQRISKREKKNAEMEIQNIGGGNVSPNLNFSTYPPTTPLIEKKNPEIEKNNTLENDKTFNFNLSNNDFMKQFGKQKDDNSKELLELIQNVIDDDPNQIKMFQQKIKDDEIKSGKKLEVPQDEEEDEADLQAIENYKRSMQYNISEFHKNKEQHQKMPFLTQKANANNNDINSILNNINPISSMPVSSFDYNDIPDTTNIIDNNSTTTNNIINKENTDKNIPSKKFVIKDYKNVPKKKPKMSLVDERLTQVMRANKKLHSSFLEKLEAEQNKLKRKERKKRGPARSDSMDDDSYKLEEEEVEKAEDVNAIENNDNNIGIGAEIKNRNTNNTTNNFLKGDITEKDMELVNNIAMGRKRQRRKNPDGNNKKLDENTVVNIDDNDDDNEENNNQKKPWKNRRKKKKKKGKKPIEITLGDSDIDIEENNPNNENKENNAANNNNEINEISDDSNNDDNNNNTKKEEIIDINNDNNTNDINLISEANMDLGITSTFVTDNLLSNNITSANDISIYNPSAAFSNTNLVNTINNSTNNNLSSMPLLPGKQQKEFISSLISTLIKYYGYETLVNCIIHRQKSNNDKLDEFVEYLLKNNSYSDIITCLINCKKENSENKENIGLNNNNISTSSLLGNKKGKDSDIEIIGLEGDFPVKKKRKYVKWADKIKMKKEQEEKERKEREKSGMFDKELNDSIVSLDEEGEEKIKLNDDFEDNYNIFINKKNKNNLNQALMKGRNTFDLKRMIDMPPPKFGDHYHKGKDGLIFRYVFRNLKNENMAIYVCSEIECKSKAVLKIKEQEFKIITEHSNYYLHKGLMDSVINDKNFKLMNKKGYKDIQFTSNNNKKEIEWAK